ncbi:alpha/beta-hydrolase [Punctularia strigosozonata HHB-11173 SS5]|uniref:Alpha/beta-hydrolase n=1 Tax=Punctularia strigosozonata (strain HHB-11173) TaxID=741275 RepID=R7S4S7_PUNST|nr:alpha/beta-hydrolase [Punctularia strigosozonata HHB-11173 SS5]EIN04822.1 alpha/beta-hydrolase [Punctularia strigosozonata HHB-11173 SS5]
MEGAAKGEVVQIGPLATYVAEPPAPNAHPDTAIVFFTDVFGLRLNNPKLMADKMAETTGIRVYVPDLFFGEGLDPDSLPIPDTAEAARNQTGILWTVKKTFTIAGLVPWYLRHKASKHLGHADEFIQALKTEHGLKTLGAVGYCYGAPFCTRYNASGDAQAIVLVHPSSLKAPDDFASLRAPVSFALAEEDHAFGPELAAQAKAALKDKPFDVEFVTYKGTAHGFGCRPNYAIEDVRKGFEGAFAQTCSFFKKHLI